MTFHEDDCPTARRVEGLLKGDTADDDLLLHLKVLAAEALPPEMLAGPDPAVFGAGIRVGGVALTMNCPPELAVILLRRSADAIERDYLAELAQNN